MQSWRQPRTSGNETNGASATLGVLLFVAAATAGYAFHCAVNLSVETGPIASARDQSVQAAPQLIDLAPEAKRPQLAELKETTARPIFFASRRMPAPDVQPSAVLPQSPAPALRLVGIMKVGSERKALVRAGDEGSSKWIAVGEEFEGWRLAKIAGDAATIQSLGAESELSLYPPAAPRLAQPPETERK
jgi:type II secretory pathway component PulC